MSETTGFVKTQDNVKISYRHFFGGKDTVVVICHGFTNSKDSDYSSSLNKALSADFDIFAFDMRGHGKSSGVFTMSSREEKDFIAVLDYLKGKYAKTAVVSFSMGAAVAINTLSKRSDVQSLVCISPVSDVSKIDNHFWEMDVEGDIIYSLFTAAGRRGRGVSQGPFWLKKEKPSEAVKKLKIPVLYIHGSKDWLIKPHHSRRLYANTQSEKKFVFIENGTHAEYLLRDHYQDMITLIKDWFKQTIV
jgi:pimeloyl-ACP methyl ester carboxylesterase